MLGAACHSDIPSAAGNLVGYRPLAIRNEILRFAQDIRMTGAFVVAPALFALYYVIWLGVNR